MRLKALTEAGFAVFVFSLFLASSAFPLVNRDQRQPAPNFTCPVWLNSPPLSLKQLRGKVVLVDFWEYTCINCIRTFPYLRRWHQLYAPLGLVVIGVHTPEFNFARDLKRVADATKRFGFKFPIAVDSDRRVWRAFDAEAWPTKYLIDKDGKVALVHQGEGDYAAFENEIQELLKEANPKLEFAASQFQDIPPEPRFGNVCRQPTPEIYLGAERGTLLANDAGYRPLTAAVYQLPHEIPPDRYALSGRWLAAPEYIQHVSKGADDYLRLSYRAKAVYIVAGSDDGKPKNISIAQDGKPIAEDARGVDVKTDSKGGTYASLSGKRMYYLVNNPKFEEHQLEIRAEEPSLSLYSFTFGNECENAFEHK